MIEKCGAQLKDQSVVVAKLISIIGIMDLVEIKNFSRIKNREITIIS